MSHDSIPGSADGYAPLLPADPAFHGARIDTGDKRYLAAREAAHTSKLTQAEFTTLLGVEAARTMRAAGLKTAAANSRHVTPSTEIPRREPPPRAYKDMTFAQRLRHGGHV